ncbi:MAG: hypothetical protein L6Q83_09445 [Gammaproteobacteria bacterium]|nr:hypothetical protein [Gammaproteobacteria bacterium]
MLELHLGRDVVEQEAAQFQLHAAAVAELALGDLVAVNGVTTAVQHHECLLGAIETVQSLSAPCIAGRDTPADPRRGLQVRQQRREHLLARLVEVLLRSQVADHAEVLRVVLEDGADTVGKPGGQRDLPVKRRAVEVRCRHQLGSPKDALRRQRQHERPDRVLLEAAIDERSDVRLRDTDDRGYGITRMGAIDTDEHRFVRADGRCQRAQDLRPGILPQRGPVDLDQAARQIDRSERRCARAMVCLAVPRCHRSLTSCELTQAIMPSIGRRLPPQVFTQMGVAFCRNLANAKFTHSGDAQRQKQGETSVRGSGGGLTSVGLSEA